MRSLVRSLVLGWLKGFFRMTAFVGKEFVEVIRRPSVLFSLVLGPFFIMALFGVGYSGQRRPLDTILVVPAGADLPRETQAYQPVLGPAVNLVEVMEDAESARQRLAQRRVDLVVTVPANVEDQFLSGQQSVIGVEYNQVDPIRDNYARFVADRQVAELNRTIIERAAREGQQYAVSNPATQQAAQEVAHIPPEVVAAPTRADLQNRAPITPTVIAYYAPAVLALILQHMAITLTALSLVRERSSGAMDIFRVAPVRTLEILIGKYLAYGLFNLSIGAIISLLMVFLLGIPLLGDAGLFAAVVALLTFASLGVGLLVSSLVDTERQAVQLAMLVLLASVFFGGFVLPLDEFRLIARAVAYLLPVTYGIRLLQDTMLRGGTNVVWQIWALAGFGVALFLLTALALRRALARG